MKRTTILGTMEGKINNYLLPNGPQHALSGPGRTLGLKLLGIVCFLVHQFRALGDTLARAVGYCLVFLSFNFRPQGTLWL